MHPNVALSPINCNIVSGTMSKVKNRSQGRTPTLFKRLNAPYRVVFIDDESLEEVASFNLTKSRMYMLFSTLFVLTVVITVTILLFTPLKYYIPGYGNNKTYQQVVRLKQNVDSLADLVSAQQAYAANIRNVITGNYKGPADTTLLDMEKVKRDAIKSILPPPDVIKQQAIQSVKKEAKAKSQKK